MGGPLAWELPTHALKIGFYGIFNATHVFPFKVFLSTFIFRTVWLFTGPFEVFKIQWGRSLSIRTCLGKPPCELWNTSSGVPPSGTRSSPGLSNLSSGSVRKGGKSEVKHGEPSGDRVLFCLVWLLHLLCWGFCGFFVLLFLFLQLLRCYLELDNRWSVCLWSVLPCWCCVWSLKWPW